MALLALLPLGGCFTGIESTPRISEGDLRRDSRTERPEERYLADIAPEPPARWAPGKRWTVTDSRSERILGADLAGREIAFEAFDSAMSITGVMESIIRFSSPAGPVAYRMAVTPDSLRRAPIVAIPYAVEQSVVDATARRLAGNTYYITSSLWNDLRGGSLRGLKNIAVTIDSVTPGSGIYPLRLAVSYAPIEGVPANPGAVSPADSRRHFSIAMAAPGDAAGGTTRSFASIFSLSDPRLRYPRITDAVWNNIIAGRVDEGMTRDECRLAIGTPEGIDRRPGYSSLQEIWTYPDGIRLVFVDGLLTTAYR